MKTTLTPLFLFCSLAFHVNATVFTVSNSAALVAQYSDVALAIGAASPGDTIYIHASPNTYPGIDVTKRLVLLGAGHHPKTTSGQSSAVGNVTVQSAATGSEIYGLNFISLSGAGGTSDTINLTVRFCRSRGSVGVSVNRMTTNYLVENNLFDNGSSISFSAHQHIGVMVRNNVFGSKFVFNGAFIGGPKDNVVIDHNIFIGNYASSYPISGAVNCVVSNNIFHNSNLNNNLGTGCSFLNNITHQCTATLPTTGNTGSGNINADPLFVNFPVGPTNFSYDYDFRLGPLSPGLNAATDGTDIGIYGNNITFSMTGEPDNFPVMRNLDIFNATVPLNGTLNIRLDSTVPVRN